MEVKILLESPLGEVLKDLLKDTPEKAAKITLEDLTEILESLKMTESIYKEEVTEEKDPRGFLSDDTLSDFIDNLTKLQEGESKDKSKEDESEAEDEDESKEAEDESEELLHSLHVPTNISKGEDGTVYIQMVVPGYTEEQVSVEVSEDFGVDVITVAGEPVPRKTNIDRVVTDFALDGFTSTVEVSKEIAEGQYDVNLTNGILNITIIPAKKINTIKVVF